VTYEKELKGLAKRYGDDLYVSLAEAPSEVEVISSGVLSIDAALQIPKARTAGVPVLGGYARGHMTEMFGPEGGGKSTLAIAHLAQVVRQGGRGIYIDVERKASAVYFRSIFREQDADPSGVEIVRPPHAEAVWETVKAMGPEVDCIVIDSLADMMTKARLDSDVGEIQPGMLARVTQDGLRKSAVWDTDCILLMINQVREKIGGFSRWPETTPGGRSRLHRAITRIRIQRAHAPPLKEHGKLVGIAVKAQVKKNQLGAPFAEALFRLYWGKGVDRRGDMIETAMNLGVIVRAGSHYYLPFDNPVMTEESKIAGKKSIRPAMDANPEVYDMLEAYLGEWIQAGTEDE
jgi:recombination protein RecA